MKPPGVMPGTCNTSHRHTEAVIAIGENEMSDYYESICKLYEKTMQRLEAEDYQGEDYRFLKGEAHAYFTAMQLSEFHSTPDEPPAPVLTDVELPKIQVWVLKQLTWGIAHARTLDYKKREFEILESGCIDRGFVRYHSGGLYENSWYEITNIGRAALKAHQASMEAPPRCACGNTNDLTEVIATPDGTYHLCPEHLAEENIS